MGRHAASQAVRRLALSAVVIGTGAASIGLVQAFDVHQQQSTSLRVMDVPTTALPIPSDAFRAPTQKLSRGEKVGKPVRVSIPSIGLEGSIDVELGVTADRELEVPKDPEDVGWWKGGPRPGEAGPAVLVGHKDSTTGPAVFYGLGDVLPGDVVHVEDARGVSRTFTVTDVEQVDKYEFLTEKVYGKTPGPELRILTCGGRYDEKTQEYEDNFVVYASIS